MKISILSVVMTILCAIFSISATNESSQTPFKSIKIGIQTWMTENLNVSSFRNGELIPEAEKAEEWKKATTEQKPAWCYYNGDSVNGRKYGKLYNWYAVNDSRGLAPQGWHIPVDDEYSVLIIYLGGSHTYNEIAPKMKSKSGWESNGQGNNSSGFSSLPAGGRNGDGKFGNLGYDCYYWTLSEEQNHSAAHFYSIAFDDSTVWQVNNFKSRGYSVRCVKN
jgi:uncharacterized protein (TIGR02145 family)